MLRHWTYTYDTKETKKIVLKVCAHSQQLAHIVTDSVRVTRTVR